MATSQVLYIISRILATNEIAAVAALIEKSHNLMTMWYSGEKKQTNKTLESKDLSSNLISSSYQPSFGSYLTWICFFFAVLQTYLRNIGKLKKKKQRKIEIQSRYFIVPHPSPTSPPRSQISHTHTHPTYVYEIPFHLNFLLQRLSVEQWRLTCMGMLPGVLPPLWISLRPTRPSQQV